MNTIDNYNFGTIAEVLDNMTDEEAKEYFESLSADMWIDEYKNEASLM